MKKAFPALLLVLSLLFSLPAFSEGGEIPAAANKVTLVVGEQSLSVPADTEYVDLGSLAIPYSDETGFQALDRFILSLPNLRKLDMYATDIRRPKVEHLAETFPDIEFGWTMVILPCANKLHRDRTLHRVRSDATAFSTLHNKYCTAHTDLDFSVLRYCRNLEALDLGHNAVSDLSFLYSLPNLKVLILALNQITDITPIGSLKELQYLEIFRNKITDISPLASCRNLVDLNLCNNEITDYSPLKELKSLRRLWLGRSNLWNINIPVNELKSALPDCFINSTATGTNGGWRNHPRFEQGIALIFDFNNPHYVPFPTLE